MLQMGSNVVGIAGLVVCCAAVLLRVMGNFHIAGVEVMTVFNGGMALLLIACLAKLEVVLQALAKHD